MRIAAAIVDDCQDAIGDHIDADNSFDPLTLMRLQRLDILSQRLVEIGRMLDRLAVEVPGETPAGVFDDIRLSDLLARLRGESSEPPAEPDIW